MDLDDLRLGDLQTFLAVQRTGSVNAAARALGGSASQVSKTIARLEKRLGARLLARSSKGVVLTDFGRNAQIEIEAIVERLVGLRRRSANADVEVSVAGESYLLSMCVPTIATCIPGISVRALEMPTSAVRASAGEGSFELALLPRDAERLPPTWETASLGRIRKALFGTPRLAKKLGRAVAPEALRDIPFVVPIFQTGGRYLTVDDGCPIPLSDRRIGHRVVTMQMALDIAAASDQLVFGPAIAARLHLGARSLVEIPVTGWSEEQALFLAYDSMRVSVRLKNAVLRSLNEHFLRGHTAKT